MSNVNLLEFGFEIKKNSIDIDTIDKINKDIDSLEIANKKGGVRHVDTKSTVVSSFIHSASLSGLIAPYFLDNFTIIRCILFNKTMNNNWFVTWHQDKTVAVSKRLEQSSWGPWSVKEGILHVQPPLPVLQSMVTVRINLDDVGAGHGALEILPNSHRLGVIPQQMIPKYIAQYDSLLCTGKRGDALVMRPLLLHRSSKMIAADNRRVLHIECSDYPLPAGVDWV